MAGSDARERERREKKKERRRREKKGEREAGSYRS